MWNFAASAAPLPAPGKRFFIKFYSVYLNFFFWHTKLLVINIYFLLTKAYCEYNTGPVSLGPTTPPTETQSPQGKLTKF